MTSTGDIPGYPLVRYVFLAFNCLVWIFGCGLLVVGIWLQNVWTPYGSLLPNYSYLSATALCIAVGLITLAVGFFGCFGALMENKCMLLVYFIFVFLIVALEIVVIILGFTFKEKVQDTVRQELLVSIKQMYHPEDSSLVNTWNSLHSDLACCGVNNYSDWYFISAWPDRKRVPDSCCKAVTEDCGLLESVNWNEQGCMSEVEYWFMQNMHILGVIAVTMGVIQILTMVASLVLFCHFRTLKS